MSILSFAGTVTAAFIKLFLGFNIVPSQKNHDVSTISRIEICVVLQVLFCI